MQKRGIGTIITCNYKNTSQPLLGTEEDEKEMIRTSNQLKFHNFTLCNPTKAQIKEVQSISCALPLLEAAANFKAIMFVFSGHGCNPDIISSQDLQKLDVQTDIVLPLIKHQQITHIPKLFFVDACRGNNTLEQKGSKGPIATETNYRIDYSTVPRHKVFMTPNGRQSEWLPTLAKELRTHTNQTVQNIAAEVNQQVFKRTQRQGETCTQQGDTKDRLNIGQLYLQYIQTMRTHTSLVYYIVIYCC